MMKVNKRFVPYFFLVAVVIALQFPISVSSLQSVSTAIIKDREKTIRSGFVEFDRLLTRISQFVVLFESNLDVMRTAQLDQNLYPADYISMIESKQILTTVTSGFPYLYEAHAYFYNNDIVLTNKNIFHDRYTFYSHFFTQQNLSFADWEAGLSSDAESSLISLIIQNQSGQKIDLLCLNSDLSSYGKLSLFFKKDDLLEIFTTEGLKNWPQTGEWLSLSYRNNFIASSDGAPEVVKANNLQLKNGQAVFNGVRYTVISMADQTTGLTITYGLPISIYFESIRSTLLIIVLYLLLALLGGIGLSAYLSHRQGRFVRQFADNLAHMGFSSGSFQEEKNLYQTITRIIQDVTETKNNMQQRLDEQTDTVRSELLERLYRRGLHDNHDKVLFDNYFPNVDINGNYLVIDIRLHNDLVQSSQNAEKIGAWRLLIRQVIDQTFADSEYCGANVHFSGNTHVIVLLKAVDDQSFPEGLSNILKQFYIHFASLAGYNIAIGASMIHREIEQMSTAFLEASSASRYSNIASRWPIHSFEELDIPSEQYIPEITSIEKLQHLISSGDKEKALAHLDAEYINTFSAADFSQFYFSSRMAILKAVSKNINYEALINLLNNPPEDLPENSIKRLRDAVGLACDEIEQKKRSHNDQLKESVLQYVNLHYRNPDLYTNRIADALSISEKYILSFIKEQTGVGLSEYIEKLRLDYARNLLLHSDQNVKTVANSSGFININTFYKAFKRNFGISPGEYRMSLRNG